MAHLIDTMAYTGQTPWHGLGNQLPEKQSLDIWQQAAGMDWTIEQSDVMFNVASDALHIRPYSDSKVLYRSDTLAPLSVVSSRYNVVQPHEVLHFYQDLVEACGFELETAGSLKGGRKLCALASHLARHDPPRGEVPAGLGARGDLRLGAEVDDTLADASGACLFAGENADLHRRRAGIERQQQFLAHALSPSAAARLAATSLASAAEAMRTLRLSERLVRMIGTRAPSTRPAASATRWRVLVIETRSLILLIDCARCNKNLTM